MDTINVAAGSDAQPQAPVAGMEQDFWWQQETNDPVQEPPDAQTQTRSAQDQCMVAGCGCGQRHLCQEWEQKETCNSNVSGRE